MINENCTWKIPANISLVSISIQVQLIMCDRTGVRKNNRCRWLPWLSLTHVHNYSSCPDPNRVFCVAPTRSSRGKMSPHRFARRWGQRRCWIGRDQTSTGAVRTYGSLYGFRGVRIGNWYSRRHGSFLTSIINIKPCF